MGVFPMGSAVCTALFYLLGLASPPRQAKLAEPPLLANCVR
jgi:hypothetical protein